jgi:hypothetical protein
MCLEELDDGGRGYCFDSLGMNDSLISFLISLSE